MSHHLSTHEASHLRVNLLGPLEITVGGTALSPSGLQVPRLLALLALRNGAPVPIETVIDVIWADAPPAHARRVALNLVGRMRKLIGSHSALTHQGAVSLKEASTDLDEFEALCAKADGHLREGQASSERESLFAALRLVRGVPFAGWEDDPFFGAEAVRLQRAVDRTRLREAQLALDEEDYDAARDGAEAVLARDRLSQRAVGVLMSGLAGAGRVREALTAFQDAKKLLAAEAGLDPDPSLAALYADILRSGAAGDAQPEPKPQLVPRQLPALLEFVPVHAPERAHARRLLSSPGAASPILLAVNGAGGIGKSALALELAHSVKDRFPDGQLFVDLRGAAPGHEPLDADRAVRHFMRSLGYGGEQWADAEEAAARFRSVTADLRLLFVLDDALDADQVRPLLPDGPGCAVIVTSRRALPSLREAEHLELPLLGDSASRELFRAGVDHAFAPEDERALDGVLARCGGLPLALCVVAARFNAAEPGSLPGILESLSDESLGLAGFEDGENSLGASLAGSLKALASAPAGNEAVELFTMMALHPGSAVPVEIAAALVDRPVPAVRRVGELLGRYRLAEPDATGHFVMHDLVRLFAAQEAARLDRSVADAAVRRMQSAYLAAAAQVYRFFREHVHKAVGRNRLEFVADLAASPIDFASPREADEWFIDHLPVLVELVRGAGETDTRFPGLLYLLLKPPLDTRAGMALELRMIGSAAAELLVTADAPWAVYVHNDLAELLMAIGENAEANRYLDHAEQSARRHGRLAEAVVVKASRVRILQRLGEVDHALGLVDEAIEEARQLGMRDIEAHAGGFRSYLLDLRGDHDAAIAQSAELVAYAEDETAGVTPVRKSDFLSNHAFRLIHGGRAAEGLAVAEEAAANASEQGFDGSYLYAEILWGQAEAHQALGDTSAAEALWSEAAELLLANGRITSAQYDEILAGERPVIDPAG